MILPLVVRWGQVLFFKSEHASRILLVCELCFCSADACDFYDRIGVVVFVHLDPVFLVTLCACVDDRVQGSGPFGGDGLHHTQTCGRPIPRVYIDMFAPDA